MSRMSPAVLIDCFINPVRDAMVKVCPSVSLSLCLTRVFFPVLDLDWSSWATMLQLSPSLIWRSAAGTAKSLGGHVPRRSLSSTVRLT